MTYEAIPTEMKNRIIAAAQELYDQLDRERFPTVDAVRRHAKADMNSTSSVMREWRKAQQATPVAVAVAIPEAVAAANTAALTAIWQQAQELANESLSAAQAAWEAERQELDALRKELAEAYESQEEELVQVKAEAANAKELHQMEAERLASDLAGYRDDLRDAAARADKAELQAIEANNTALDLRLEVERLQSSVNGLTTQLAEKTDGLTKALTDLDEVRAQLSGLTAKAEALDTSAKQQISDLKTQARNDREEQEKKHALLLKTAQEEATAARQAVESVKAEREAAVIAAAAANARLEAAEKQAESLLDRLSNLGASKESKA